MNEKRCDTCKHYSAFREPRERSDGAIIYGYCFKSGDKDYSSYMGKGYPVFIPGGGYVCKEYKRKNAPADDAEPVRHGRCISTGYDELYCEFGDCSICGADMPIKSKFCPNCGAKMDLEGDAHE